LFTDLAQRITYCSSHDVQNYYEQRLYPFLMEELCNERGLDRTNLEICEAHNIALEQMSSTFAIMLTTVGVPMFLAGEEFADLHDINHSDWRLKMSDPIDWRRRFLPGRCNLFERVKQLIKLRTGSASLQRNEIEFFGLSGNNAGFVPSFDENDGERVFIYCRTGGKDLGAEGQILVVANCGPKSYPAFQIDWHWGANRLTEHAGVGQPMPSAIGYKATLELNAYQVRVFST